MLTSDSQQLLALEACQNNIKWGWTAVRTGGHIRLLLHASDVSFNRASIGAEEFDISIIAPSLWNRTSSEMWSCQNSVQ